MRLIQVRTFLDIEEGKRIDPDAIVLKDLVDEELAQIKYGILSHCWGHPKEEVQYKEMDALIRMGGTARKKLRERSGYQKIRRSCEQAWKDGLAWLWVDTCCINKESSAELSEALNSMFRWYEDSERCYVYLHDLHAKALPTTSNEKKFSGTSGWPRWFSRGWTLQELVAPTVVHFFNQDWHFIGDKKNHAQTISSITRIPSRILRHGLDAHRHSAAQIMSWAADRKTTRTEDRAYSLMGLFGVHMPMLYGEGKDAFRRLQLEIIRMTNDHSIFAWDRKDNGWSGSVLADDPSFFRACHDIVNMEPDEYLAALRGVVPEKVLSDFNEESIRTYTVTNAGIRIRLPLQRCRGSQSVFEARLACCRSFDSSPISIVLVSFKSTYHRYFGQSQTIHGATATFQLLYLVCQEDKRQKDFTFKVDDRALEYEGFIRRCAFPKRASLNSGDNSITLSYTNHCAVIVYANSETGTCFALAVGYCSGYEWLHVIPDTPAQQFFDVRQTTTDPWDTYAKRVYDRAWVVSPKHAPRVARARTPGVARLHYEEDGPHLVKHAHLPKSIRGVQLVYQRLPQPNTCLVTMDITRCAGCCVSPDAWQTLDGLSANNFDMPCLMLDPASLNTQVKRNAMHRFLIDGVPTSFLSAAAEPDKIKVTGPPNASTKYSHE
ncbi:heterokaryon incompatibility protein-domain-containing protein [Pisolithus croceorrhizus]|nr:heterokaryon incompatibility protein-domain-containing protein [Pisolithus croceorrhizus]